MMKLITNDLLDTITLQAQDNPRLRMNYNLHASLEDPVQRMLNALEPGSYLPPHRHSGKDETYFVLRGSLMALFFDEKGNVTEKVELNPATGNLGLEIPAGMWHNILVLESGTVIFEMKQGPYQPLPPEDFAPWAPAPTDEEGVAAFMKRIAL